MPATTAPELRGRREVLVALVELVAGQLPPADAALRVERTLAWATATGCVALVERYAELPERLRGS